MTDPISAFIDHMRSVGCAPDASVAIVANDKSTRYRLEGDRPNTTNGLYVLNVDHDGFAYGRCINFRDGVSHSWHSKSTRKASDEDRAAWKKRRDDAKVAQERERAAEAAAAAEKARRIWAEADREGSNAYLDRKGLTLAHIGCRMSRGSVVVPMWSSKKLVGLQFIDGDGDKLFLKGTAKEGAYHAIPGTGDMIVIGEGLATMAAVQRALGCSAVIAFDAGNLKPVAQAMDKAYPEKRIVIAADADQWTIPANKRPADWDNPPGDDPRWHEWRKAGLCVDTGAEKAMQAAVAIGGAVVVSPPFPGDDAERRTDWWDYAAAEGDDAVRAAFETAMNPPVVQDYSPDDIGDGWEPDPGYGDVVEDDPWGGNTVLRAVRPLGRNDKTFYFFPRACGQIIEFTGPALANMQNLVTMAPKSVWEMNFEAKSGEKKMAGEASLMLIEACNRLGIYDPDTKRGVGVWLEGETPLMNAGDKLYWAGGSCLPPDYKSKNVYVMGGCVGRLTDDQMGNKDAAEILRICLALSWKSRTAGYMLAGWIVTALVAGALRWRSHIVLTGEKGAGKSWVLENIIKPLLGRLALSRDGGTTEPKLRIDIGSTTRPVVMDEGESETMRDRTNMEQIFMLARKASSGSNVANFNGVYPIRSSFCFAAINPRIVQGADLDRNTILHLVVNRTDGAAEEFRKLQRRVSSAITEASSERLLSRAFHNLPALLANIETFSDVLEQQEGSKRFGDQFGTLIAGAYSLTSTGEITREAAVEWCAKHEWRWAKTDNEQTDSERLLQFLLSARVRYDDRGMAREASVGRLIDRALNADGSDRDGAVAALGEYGMRADRDWLCVASPCKPIGDMLRDTPWAGSYRRALGELDGAEARDKMRFTTSMRVRAVAVPMRHVLAEDDQDEEELPFDVGDFA